MQGIKPSFARTIVQRTTQYVEVHVFTFFLEVHNFYAFELGGGRTGGGMKMPDFLATLLFALRRFARFFAGTFLGFLAAFLPPDFLAERFRERRRFVGFSADRVVITTPPASYRALGGGRTPGGESSFLTGPGAGLVSRSGAGGLGVGGGLFPDIVRFSALRIYVRLPLFYTRK